MNATERISFLPLNLDDHKLRIRIRHLLIAIDMRPSKSRTNAPPAERPSTRGTRIKPAVKEPEKKQSATARALSILRAFETSGNELNLTKACSITGLHKATVFRLLTLMSQRGLLIKDEASGLYRLGYEIVAAGEAAKALDGITAVAMPIMQRLNLSTRETVYLSRREGDFRVDVDKVDGLNDLRRVISLGIYNPFHEGAASKVLASSIPEDELLEILQRTAPKKFDISSFQRELEVVRRKGFVEGKHIQRGAAVSVPLVDADLNVLAALTVTTPLEVFDNLRGRLISETRSASQEINIAIASRPNS